MGVGSLDYQGLTNLTLKPKALTLKVTNLLWMPLIKYHPPPPPLPRQGPGPRFQSRFRVRVSGLGVYGFLASLLLGLLLGKVYNGQHIYSSSPSRNNVCEDDSLMPQKRNNNDNNTNQTSIDVVRGGSSENFCYYSGPRVSGHVLYCLLPVWTFIKALARR